MNDPFIDQTLIISTTRSPTRITRPTGTSRTTESHYQYEATIPTTKRPRTQTTEQPIRRQPQTPLVQNIKEVFKNPFQNPSATAYNTPATVTVDTNESFISNQLKLIMLHVQSTDQKTDLLLEKIANLEEIVNGLLSERPNTSKYLLLKGVPHLPVLTLLTEVRAFVEKTLDLPSLSDSILTASRTEDGVLLSVRSIVDKLRILFRAQTSVDTAPIEVVDPDKTSTSNYKRQAPIYADYNVDEFVPSDGSTLIDIRNGK